MTYDGDLVTLRPIEPGDAAAIARWLADPEVTRYLSHRYPVSAGGVAAWIAGQTPPRRFMVLRRDTGEVVGSTALRGGTPESRNVEYDIVVGERSARGVGIGTDATRATCRVAFDRLGLHRVHLWVFTENAGAIRAYEKCGFVHEGTARHRFFKHGRWHDCHLMGLLAGELR